MSHYDATTHDWSELPRDLYVIEIKPHDIGVDVTMCSVPMITLPEVRYVRADMLAGDGWQDISTAPTKGPAFLVWCPDRHNTYLVIPYNGRLEHFGPGGDPLRETPTHWRPLPAAPTGNPEIIAPPECDCDDPECLARHEPLTLRQAYDNCLERLRQAEDALTVTKEAWMEEAATIVTARMALYSESAMGFPRLALSEAASAIRAAAIRNRP